MTEILLHLSLESCLHVDHQHPFQGAVTIPRISTAIKNGTELESGRESKASNSVTAESVRFRTIFILVIIFFFAKMYCQNFTSGLGKPVSPKILILLGESADGYLKGREPQYCYSHQKHQLVSPGDHGSC